MQSTKNILLIRPSHFTFNSETASSNVFQNKAGKEDDDLNKQKAIEEFELFVEKLKSKGVNVFIFDDTPSPQKPDAVFPNNWITFHSDGTVILYPMFAHSRRSERRNDIIDSIGKKFKVTNIIDVSDYEKENKFLEGTGSIVFDHDHKIAYACLSPRTNKEVFVKVSERMHYKPVFFHAYDRGGREIYHTNVMMSIAEKFAVICLDSISDNPEREFVSHSLAHTGHEVIEITFEQVNNFAGNMLAVQTSDQSIILILSQRAFDSLTDVQKKKIGKYGELFPHSLNTIETIGGGSARCMMAEVFLEMKSIAEG